MGKAEVIQSFKFVGIEHDLEPLPTPELSTLGRTFRHGLSLGRITYSFDDVLVPGMPY
jgi:hypothetical protein